MPPRSFSGNASDVHDHAHTDASHGHGHAHHHGDHHHPEHRHDASRRALWIALVLTGGFAVVEAFGGWWAHSLALISDAGHMATDAAAFVVALIATAVAQRPPSTRASYGYARAEVIAAFINALAMLALIVWIAVEAVQRLLAPAAVAGDAVIAIAVVGLAINVVVAWMLARSGGGLNARAALIHVMGDLLGSVAAITAGAVIRFTGWYPIDPILSVVVALLILRSTWALLRQSTHVLMEQVPQHLSFDAIGRALAALPNVAGVHDLHVWLMSQDRVALSAHLTIIDGTRWPATLAAATQLLARQFDIRHVTLQPSWPMPLEGRRVIPVVEESTARRRVSGPAGDAQRRGRRRP
jgi:cobalt-zinc-cadmium efflux system protein